MIDQNIFRMRHFVDVHAIKMSPIKNFAIGNSSTNVHVIDERTIPFDDTHSMPMAIGVKNAETKMCSDMKRKNKCSTPKIGTISGVFGGDLKKAFSCNIPSYYHCHDLGTGILSLWPLPLGSKGSDYLNLECSGLP